MSASVSESMYGGWMKLNRIYCRTADGEDRIYMGFQTSGVDLFDRHNPQLNNLMNLLDLFPMAPSGLFKAYEDEEHIQMGKQMHSVTSVDMLEAFRIHMDEKQISLSELARRMKVDKTYLSSLFCLRYSTNLTMYTIRRIAEALEVKLSNIFSIAEKLI